MFKVFEKLKLFQKKKTRAFTLVESTVSLSVVACLIAVFIPTFAQVQKKSSEMSTIDAIKTSYNYIQLNDIESGTSSYQNGVMIAKDQGSSTIYYAIVTKGDVGEIYTVKDKSNNRYTANDFYALPKSRGNCVSTTADFDARLTDEGKLVLFLASNIQNNSDVDGGISVIQASHIVYGETTSIDEEGKGGVLSTMSSKFKKNGDTTFSVKFISSGSVAPTSVSFDGVPEDKEAGEITRTTLDLSSTYHNYIGVVTAPTCLDVGYTTKTCSDCGDVFTCDEVEPLGHSLRQFSAVMPTCTSDGHNDYSACQRAGCDYTTRIDFPMLNHKYENGSSAYTELPISATCTSSGKIVYTCALCNDSYQVETSEPLGHDYIEHDRVEPTCLTIGNEAYRTCSRCDYTNIVQLSPLGHDYSAVTTEPTCTEDGYTTRTCGRCNDTLVEDYVSALGHNFTREITKYPTCVEQGVETFTCSVCSFVENKPIEEYGHNYVDHAGVAPTCTTKGYASYKTCSNCDFTNFSELAALGHNYTHVVVAPTCASDGYTEHTCARCNNTYRDATTQSTGHEYDNYTVITEATCTADGLAQFTCLVCGDVKQTTITSPGHSVFTDSEVKATCLNTGLTEGSHCIVCNKVFVAQQPTPALGHNYSYEEYTWTGVTACSAVNLCTRCGDSRTENATITNTVKTAATCTVMGTRTYTATFKDTYNGKKLFANQTKDNQDIPALGHNYGTPTYTWNGVSSCSASTKCTRCTDTQTESGTITNTVKTAATCTVMGTRTYTAKFTKTYNGSALFSTQTKNNQDIPALGHSWDSGTVTTAATCITDGNKRYTCTVCSATKDEAIPSNGSHSPVTDPAVAATCTETGLTEGSHCSACGEILTAQQTVAKLGHNSVSSGNYSATCTGTGLTGRTVCSRCGTVTNSGSTVAATGHSYTTTTSATCTSSGTETCSNCSQTRTIAALGHDTRYYSGGSPTCTSGAWSSGYYCTRCSYDTSTYYSALGHNYVSSGNSSATCTSSGWSGRTECSRCGKVGSSGSSVPATGHSYRTTTPATCTSAGTQTCSGCGATSSISKLPHSYRGSGCVKTCSCGASRGSHRWVTSGTTKTCSRCGIGIML